jgi:hypothetical protein
MALGHKGVGSLAAVSRAGQGAGGYRCVHCAVTEESMAPLTSQWWRIAGVYVTSTADSAERLPRTCDRLTPDKAWMMGARDSDRKVPWEDELGEHPAWQRPFPVRNIPKAGDWADLTMVRGGAQHAQRWLDARELAPCSLALPVSLACPVDRNRRRMRRCCRVPSPLFSATSLVTSCLLQPLLTPGHANPDVP